MWTMVCYIFYNLEYFRSLLRLSGGLLVYWEHSIHEIQPFIHLHHYKFIFSTCRYCPLVRHILPDICMFFSTLLVKSHPADSWESLDFSHDRKKVENVQRCKCMLDIEIADHYFLACSGFLWLMILFLFDSLTFSFRSAVSSPILAMASDLRLWVWF